jgi:hypothetical protein
MTGREKKVGGWRRDLVWDGRMGRVRGVLCAAGVEGAASAATAGLRFLAREETTWAVPVNGKLSGAPHRGVGGWVVGKLQPLQYPYQLALRKGSEVCGTVQLFRTKLWHVGQTRASLAKIARQGITRIASQTLWGLLFEMTRMDQERCEVPSVHKTVSKNVEVTRRR